jgi:adenylyl- and sulfurtransferase ThiI
MIKFDSYVIRYSEIALKKGNRHLFEKKLVENIKKQIKNSKKSYSKVLRPTGRILVDSNDELNLKNIFGISSFSRAIKVPIEKDNFDNIKKIIPFFAKRLIQDKDKKSFRISCQRTNKNLKFTSVDVEKEIGALFFDQTKKKVQLKNADYELIIELVNNDAYITDEKIRAHNGLPVGIEGAVYGLIDSEEDILACWLVMRRGCNIHPITLTNKSKKDLKFLNKYSPYPLSLMKVKSLAEIEKKDGVHPIIVTGESIKGIKTFNNNIEKGFIKLTPLIFWSKNQIKKKLKEIEEK